MILKNITTKKSGHKECGLIFANVIEFEDEQGRIYRCVADFKKGDDWVKVYRTLKDLAHKVLNI